MKHLRRLVCLLTAAVLVLSMAPAALAAPEEREVTVLFTHDLHSHFLPQPDGTGGESGGYARLKTAIDAQRSVHPDALLVDGGDFSIGSLIQTLYTSQAAELRTMGEMGYDCVTLGNHEFDHGGTGFAEMLRTALASGDPLPALVDANYKPSPDNPDQLDIQRAMAACGIEDWTILERGGVKFGIFGIMGEHSDACAPTSGFELEDRFKAAERCVAELKENGAEFIICLSHSGTSDVKRLSEDELLADRVSGIDLIVSGHSHTVLEEPIVSGSTYIVSCGSYCANLGSVTFRLDGSGKTMTDCRLIPIDETLEDDPATAQMVEKWKQMVGSSYLARLNLSYDQELTSSEFDLMPPEDGIQEENTLGDLTADAILWTAENLAADLPEGVTTVAVTAAGVLRAPLYRGGITVSEAFDVCSMGVGGDGTSGYPLVAACLTGKELKAAMEVDASLTPFMTVAQLYFSGVKYAFSVHRMFFNRVYDSCLCTPTFEAGSPGGQTREIDNDALYCVVTDLYIGEILLSLREKSAGLLPVVPKMPDGSPVEDLSTCVLHDRTGSELKAWYAVAAYLQSFGEEGLSSRYSAPDGRKVVSRSWNPATLLRSLNAVTWAVFGAVLLLVLLAVLAVRLVRRQIRRRHGGHYGGKGRRH